MTQVSHDPPAKADGHAMTKPFVMSDTYPCEIALKHWLQERPTFNSYSYGNRALNLGFSSDAGGDYGKLKHRCGRIYCRDDAAVNRAERIVRTYLGWEN